MSTAAILSSNGVAVLYRHVQSCVVMLHGKRHLVSKEMRDFSYNTGSPMFRRDGIAVCIYREGHNTTALDEQSDLLLVVRPVLPCLSSMHGIRPPLFVLCADEVEAAVNVMLIYATASKNGLWSKYNLEEP